MNGNSVSASQAERRLVHAAGIQIMQARISSVIAAAPLQFGLRPSEITGTKVFLKRRDLQGVCSYKIRGAYNVMVQLTDEERTAGVAVASAENHAQDVTYTCRQLGIKGRICVPNATSKQERDRIVYHDCDTAGIVVVEDSFDKVAAAARVDARRIGVTMVEPLDSLNTIVGRGAVATEIIAQLSGQGLTLDTTYVPVGGGGLLNGVASYLSDVSPNTQVMGVEPTGATCIRATLENNGPITLGHTGLFIDGAAVARFDDLPWHILEANRNRVHPMIASEGAICEAQLGLYQNEGIIVEPVGTLSVAALEQMQSKPGKVVVYVVSSGNSDVLRYVEIMERSLVYRSLEHYFLVDFPQKPGQLRMFLSDVLGLDDDISQFEYLKCNNRETGATLVGIEPRRTSGLDELLVHMNASLPKCHRLVPGIPEYDFLT